MLGGVAVFAPGSLLCATAANADVLIGGRFVQGIGICAVLTLGRAMIRDVRQGADAVQLLARLMLIVAISPLLAPLAGSGLIAVASWRWIFLVMMALLLLAASIAWLPETRVPNPEQATAGRAMAAWKLFSDPQFRWPLYLLCAAQAGASMYLAGIAPVLLVVYRLSAWRYNLAFAVNALGMIALAQANRWLILRWGVPALLRAGSATLLLAVLLPWLMSELGSLPSEVLLVGYFFYFTAFGCLMGPATVLAMARHPRLAGMASALLGCLPFAVGAAASASASALFNGTAGPLLALQLIAAVFILMAALGIGRTSASGPAETG